ncbi:MAG: type II secretion system F family protein [Lactobacillales bacterium]|jgi:type IV pilus assembly protein PilC|nr:type II secretion system F family protein [Lactobacillales bacterium]
MPLYSYKAEKMTGEILSRKVRANSLHDIKELLRKKNARPISIIEEEETLANKEIAFFNKVNLKTIVSYLLEFSTLVSSGIQILEASRMLVEQEKDKNFRGILNDVAGDVESGMTLSSAYSKHPEAFPLMLEKTVQAAEMSGTIEKTLQQMAVYYQQISRSKSKIITALMYPIMMFFAAIGVGVFLCTSVVPTFVTIFEDLDSDLPAITKFVMAISHFLLTKGIFLLVAIVLAIIAFKVAMRDENFAMKVDILKLKIPFFGQLIIKSNFSIFLTSLSMLLSSSVPIVQALNLSKDTLSNKYMREFIGSCEIEIEQGGQLSTVFGKNWAIPIRATQMVHVGEKTGMLETMLAKLAVIYEEEVDEISVRLKTVMEPLILVVVCVMVGFIVAAVMLPMIALYGAVQG